MRTTALLLLTILALGADQVGAAHAREDSWRQVLAFLDEQLRNAGR